MSDPAQVSEAYAPPARKAKTEAVKGAIARIAKVENIEYEWFEYQVLNLK